MALELIRELWDYHHWANRRLFDVTASLGDEVARREVGGHFSVPTLLGMLTHICHSDRWWLDRWTGVPQTTAPSTDMFYGDAPKTLADLRQRWDDLEREQRRFIGALGDADLTREIEGRSRLATTFRRPLGVLLLHVPNHATHHRSEIATMLTIVSGSPPDTGINSYYGQKQERQRS
jgi:uncharacterized damage-inducible protein DinB